MIFVLRVLLIAVSLLIDTSRFLELPFVGARPMVFIAIVVCFSLRAGALTGGAWGFSSGLALGVFFADARVGAMTLGGLLAGCVPAYIKGGLFWRNWAGQAALGAVGCLLFEGMVMGFSSLRGEFSVGPVVGLARLTVDSVLTGALTPLVFILLNRMETRN